MSEQVQTEELIKKTAKKVFFQKGFLDATTQEIADAAGVNRALIHYYFRSREQLLDTEVRIIRTFSFFSRTDSSIMVSFYGKLPDLRNGTQAGPNEISLLH